MAVKAIVIPTAAPAESKGKASVGKTQMPTLRLPAYNPRQDYINPASRLFIALGSKDTNGNINHVVHKMSKATGADGKEIWSYVPVDGADGIVSEQTAGALADAVKSACTPTGASAPVAYAMAVECHSVKGGAEVTVAITRSDLDTPAGPVSFDTLLLVAGAGTNLSGAIVNATEQITVALRDTDPKDTPAYVAPVYATIRATLRPIIATIRAYLVATW